MRTTSTTTRGRALPAVAGAVGLMVLAACTAGSSGGVAGKPELVPVTQDTCVDFVHLGRHLGVTAPTGFTVNLAPEREDAVALYHVNLLATLSLQPGGEFTPLNAVVNIYASGLGDRYTLRFALDHSVQAFRGWLRRDRGDDKPVAVTATTVDGAPAGVGGGSYLTDLDDDKPTPLHWWTLPVGDPVDGVQFVAAMAAKTTALDSRYLPVILHGLHIGGCPAHGSATAPEVPLTRDQRDRLDLLAGQTAARRFAVLAADRRPTQGETQAFLGSLRVASAAFRAGFLAALDLPGLVSFQWAAHGRDAAGAAQAGKVITAIGRMMAAGSNAALQGAFVVPASFYATWQATDPTPTAEEGQARGDPALRAQWGHLLRAELVQAGQGDTATWDSALLAGITRDTIAFERARRRTNSSFVWGSVWATTFPVTAAFAAQQGPGADPARADPVAMLFDAVRRDPTAALGALIIQTAPTADPQHPWQAMSEYGTYDLHEYLFADHPGAVGSSPTTGSDPWGPALGGVLDAATAVIGSGGERTPEYASAEIVSSFVRFFGRHPDQLPPGIEPSVVAMLTHHIQDVNDTLDQRVAAGIVRTAFSDGPLVRWRLTGASLNADDLEALMTKVFAADEAAAGRPLYRQFAAVQIAALKADFLDIAHRPPVDWINLKMITNDAERADLRSARWLEAALASRTGDPGQAARDARHALDSLLILTAGDIPGEVPSTADGVVGGLAVDPIRSWALDDVLRPQTQPDVTSSGPTDYVIDQGYYSVLNWVQDAGLMPTAGLQKWAVDHPDHTGFLRRDATGHWVLRDLGALYQDYLRRQEQNPLLEDPEWIDLVAYWASFGDSRRL